MVEDYLQKHLKEIKEQLLLLKQDQKHLQRKLEETESVLTKLKRDADSGIQAFSPRETDIKRGVRMEELQKEKKKCQVLLGEYKKKIPKLELEKEELNKALCLYKEEKDKSSAMQVSSEEKMKRKILEAQENERKRIAAELHDQSVQELTSMVHKTELCSKLIQMDPIRCKLELMTMSNSIKSIIDEMRKMIYDLRPMMFDDIGFDTTVERALEKMQWQTDIKFELRCDSSIDDADQVVLITLLRIIMEACNNAIKYAKSKKITVTLKDNKEFIELEVADDGIGFDVKQKFQQDRKDNTGFGLQIMKERVALLSGTIEFYSTMGMGTKIIVKVPICKE